MHDTTALPAKVDYGRPERIERGGTTIHYWVAGGGGGTPLVCTHGAAHDHRMFAHQVQAFASGRPVIVWVIGQIWAGSASEYETADGQQDFPTTDAGNRAHLGGRRD